ncbi:hypothetical protein [Streptomyces sp. CB03911]|uniref:hypothetical protein n=1 Tax=Streptomyces sp. CB03911 TaxID=1804758 RepID=UPI00093DB62A|nr:hypothetical protein [Streptomyces sp. CB03911]OKI19278.1 hypothetical protein A6A07_07190 [Streptomyces sp. CB03911]
MIDSFGVPVEVGDYILSASTSGGRVKVGRVVQGRHGLMMAVETAAKWGERIEEPQRTGQFGYNTVILRKADGSVPVHVSGPGSWLTDAGETHEVVEAGLVGSTGEYWEYRVWVLRDPEDGHHEP